MPPIFTLLLMTGILIFTDGRSTFTLLIKLLMLPVRPQTMLLAAFWPATRTLSRPRLTPNLSSTNRTIASVIKSSAFPFSQRRRVSVSMRSHSGSSKRMTEQAHLAKPSPKQTAARRTAWTTSCQIAETRPVIVEARFTGQGRSHSMQVEGTPEPSSRAVFPRSRHFVSQSKGSLHLTSWPWMESPSRSAVAPRSTRG